MTEQEWMGCTDPQKMLEFLHDKASDRKLRLFGVACCRHIWKLLPDDCRESVEVAESFADGLVQIEQLRDAEIYDYSDEPEETVEYCAGGAVFQLCQTPVGADSVSWATLDAVYRSILTLSGDLSLSNDAIQRGAAAHGLFLREIIGNPFRPSHTDPVWLTWNDGTVRQLAETIYDDRAFDRMPILADALEDAGCTDADILDHLRSDGPHVRGCWALDRILDRS